MGKMANHRDEPRAAVGLNAKHGKAVFRIVEGDALDDTGQAFRHETILPAVLRCEVDKDFVADAEGSIWQRGQFVAYPTLSVASGGGGLAGGATGFSGWGCGRERGLPLFGGGVAVPSPT